MKLYYTLCVRLDGEQRWCAEFGDYDKDVVEAELQDYRDSYHKKKNLQIIATGDSQSDIDQGVSELNSAWGVK